MRSAPSTPHVQSALTTAIRFLARVVPHGPNEADELERAIDTIRRIASTPVQPR